MAASKTLTREQRVARAKKARASQSTPDYYLTKLADNSPDAVAASARALDPDRLARVRALLPALTEAVAA